MISPERVSFRLLTDEQVQQVHQATLNVLEKTGVVIEHPRALEILSDAGCKISGESRVRFPAHLVDEAIEKAPQSAAIYSRDGELQMTLEDRKVYYGTVTTQRLQRDDHNHGLSGYSGLRDGHGQLLGCSRRGVRCS